MIRLAADADLSRIEHMGARFFCASGLDRWFSYEPRCFYKFVLNLIASDQAVVLVGDRRLEGAVGMAAAVAYPCFFNDSHQTAQELFWWVDPEHRDGVWGERLRSGLEDWARGQGCHTMQMGALDASRPEALARLYERKGYGAKERIYCKRLT